MKPTKPVNPSKVTPPSSWSLHSPYGVLQDVQSNPLARLEDIHALLMERDGLSSSDAAIRVFGPFTSSGNSKLGMKHGADKLRPFLMLCDRADKAYALFPVGKYAVRTHLEKLEEQVPYVPHHRFDRGTPEGLLHSLGEMAGEVWSPVGGDFDLNDRPLAAFVEGCFPSVEKAREILGPLAVRHDLAHQLWGWGAVGVAAMDTSQDQVESLVRTVAKSKVAQRELAPEWTGERLAKRQAELKTECRAKGLRNFTALLATECGLPIREVTRRIKAVKGNSLGAMAEQLKRQAK